MAGNQRRGGQQRQQFQLGDYKAVADRIAEFKALYPQGSLRAADLEHPYRIENVRHVDPETGAVGETTFVVYVAAAYRTPDDQAPGIGAAWEPFPGKTNYTRDSELQNAETSAWGRAIVAVLASETHSGEGGSVASREEVRNREADRSGGGEGDGPPTSGPLPDEGKALIQAAIDAIPDGPAKDELRKLWKDRHIPRPDDLSILWGERAAALLDEIKARIKAAEWPDVWPGDGTATSPPGTVGDVGTGPDPGAAEGDDPGPSDGDATAETAAVEPQADSGATTPHADPPQPQEQALGALSVDDEGNLLPPPAFDSLDLLIAWVGVLPFDQVMMRHALTELPPPEESDGENGWRRALALSIATEQGLA